MHKIYLNTKATTLINSDQSNEVLADITGMQKIPLMLVMLECGSRKGELLQLNKSFTELDVGLIGRVKATRPKLHSHLRS